MKELLLFKLTYDSSHQLIVCQNLEGDNWKGLVKFPTGEGGT